MLTLPQDVLDLLRPLQEAGFQAYVVGGCVRDWLLHKTPKDWDICTNALPQEMKQVFQGFRQLDTGLKHGTLTVIHHRKSYEITTFRVDGDYADHRRPSSVAFVQDVRDDVARRDFTINAMAYHPDTGLVDAFGGQDDLHRRIIRAVGEPRKRFEEDALRILRGLRFAASLGFQIDPATADAMAACREDLLQVAAERIRVELSGMLVGQGVDHILRHHWQVPGVVLPEVLPAVGFDQRTPHHRYDVWEHTIRTVDAVPPVEALRWAMLFHDLGKPASFTLDEKGVGHAYGHQPRSAALADQAMGRLRFDGATRERVLQLVTAHDWPLTSNEKMLRRRLFQLGEEALWQLIDVQQADALGKGTLAEGAVIAHFDDIRHSLRQLLDTKPCYTMKTLALDGRDLISMGMKPGKAMGEMLSRLLEAVVAGELPNDRETLQSKAKSWLG